MRHIILDTKRAFSYNIRTKKRQSEGEHPPDGNGCDGIKGFRFDYRVGTMIAIPGAALAADEITTAAELFSFGTNDPTRPSSGFSRDNVEGVLPCYF